MTKRPDQDEDSFIDGTADLDRQIAEARAQWAKVEQMAADGDPMAQLIVRRMEAARKEALQQFTKSVFG